MLLSQTRTISAEVYRKVCDFNSVQEGFTTLTILMEFKDLKKRVTLNASYFDASCAVC